jgi:hypothetical protein
MDDPSHGGRGGYRRASDETWALARRDYQAGHTGEEVCARYDLRPSTLRDRARVEGWRRVDAPDPAPVDPGGDEALALPDYAQMALVALIRMNRALEAGRSVEAGRWMRLHEKLTAMAERPDPASEPPPPRPTRPGFVVNERNLEARQAAINARFAEMTNYYAHIRPPVSDNSDNSDTVFSAAPAPSPLGGDGAQGERDSGSKGPRVRTLNDPFTRSAPPPAVPGKISPPGPPISASPAPGTAPRSSHGWSPPPAAPPR